MIRTENKNTVSTFKNMNMLIVGLARSGTGAANLLSALGARVSVTDKKSRRSLEDQINKLSPSINVITGGNPIELFEAADMIVMSPGVPLSIPQIKRARIKGVPVIGELELAYQIVTGDRVRVKSKQSDTMISSLPISDSTSPAFIGVTGTNGKSTTSTLIDLMLKENGYRTLLGGNIGNALTEEIGKAISCHQSAVRKEWNADRCQLNADYIVAEVSSFQLEAIKEFRPKIAAILNITPDHLDRYNSFQDYVDAKARMFENQTSDDYLILNADDPVVMHLYHSKLKVQNANKPEVFFFSRKREIKGMFFKEGLIYHNMPQLSKSFSVSPLISADEIRILGAHNLENGMAASLAAVLSGCSFQAVKNVLKGFPGLEHRLELVREFRGIKFVNDSKGTNVGAVIKSLESFEKVILIMGGMDKESDFSVLRELIKRKVRILIVIGEAAGKISESLGDITETGNVSNLREAVELSMSKASAGDVVLLSPGCASFDMFKDFEHRGKAFKEAVRNL